VQLETTDGTYYYFKADILANLVTYSTDRRIAANLTTITAKRALDVIAMNKEGKKPDTLDDRVAPVAQKPVDLATQEDLTRFDQVRKKKKKKKKKQADSAGDKAASTPLNEASKPERN
jgi:hypothetical protein